MRIPKEKLAAVRAVLEREAADGEGAEMASPDNKTTRLSDDPWQDLLDDDS